ncbi:aromatic amino acid ammonia-lyase [Dickeya fangzhongdai]|nr:hypothetical protein [Dickeya fangzhongdai]WKV50727.1 aromatic amino acid ammonia-lyase [Dickeya fangzhongdai]
MVIRGQRYEKGVLYPSIKASDSSRAIVAQPASVDGQQISAGQETLPLSDINSMVVPRRWVEDFSWKATLMSAWPKKSSTETDNRDVTLSTRLRHGTWRHNPGCQLPHDQIIKCVDHQKRRRRIRIG